MAAINLDIGGNTSRLDRDIQKTVNKAYSINLKTKGDQPLGRITGKVNEFNKSLDASNARVIAFGASAGIIFGLQRAFSSLVTSTIEVQKSLQDINVILNVSTTQLNKFGSELFNIAKNTGQSFQEVAGAATEFSRQGLGLVETLKRTNEALILSRLSGLDTVKSVQALTAAVNSFASQAVTATEIVNKFANVDAAFAVSSADLADAISRVGSSAAQSGVSLNELIALVTSAQQTTARGGAVIGNSFKTIFTRLQRGKVIDLLGTLGISDTTAGGEIKSTIQLLQELGKVYDNLGSQQQAYVAEQVGGVFQINILKAALADLGKEYSVYNSALSTAESSTDQAIKRNEQLNKTYAAQLNALQQNAKQLAAGVGNRVLGPVFDRVVGGANELLGGINESDGKGVGAVLGKGILDGLGQLLAGPGLVLIGGIFLKLTKDFAKFGLESGKGLLGLNSAATQQKNLQESISAILQNNPKLIDRALKSEQGLNQVANNLYATLQKQTVELQNQAKVAERIAKAFYGAGVRSSGGVPVVPTSGKPGKSGKAAGYIPNFAQGDFAREELLAASLGAKNPTAQLSKGTIDGKKFIKNSREVEITGFGSNGDSAVIPNYGRGFIPNFAGTSALYPLATGSKIQDYKILLQEGANYKGPMNKPFGALSVQEANQALARSRANKGQISNKQKSGITDLGKTNKISLIYGQKAGVKPVTGSFTDSNKNRYSATFASSGYNAKVEPDESNLEDLLGKQVIDFVNRFSSIFGGNSSAAKIGSINQLANAGAFRSIAGTIFETAVTQATGSAVLQASRSGGQTAPIDYVSPNPKLRKLFNNIPGSYEAKIGDNPELVNSVADKAYRSGFFKKQGVFPGAKTKNMASGYIPNFAAIQDAVARERAAGIPSNQIYLAQEQALTGANPMGLGVFNKQDEPTKGSRKDAMRRKGFARGYIPNFAEDASAAPIGSTIAALVAQLGFLAFFLKDIRTDMTTAHTEAIESATNEIAQDKAKLDSLKTGTAEHDKLNKKIKSSTESLKKMEAGSGKFASGLMASASTIMIAAPMFAALIKNAIGSETKGARAASSAVEGVGQGLAMTSMASMLATTRKMKNIIGVLGTAATIAFSAFGGLKELGTDLPELARAAEKASQKLSEFENIGQQANTALEQITDLRNKGQAKEAGTVENKILTDIAKEVKDPNVAAQMQRAIINQDSEALRKAIEDNTKGLREERDKTDRSAAVSAGIKGIKEQTGPKNLEKRVLEAKNIFSPSLFDLKSATKVDESGKKARSTGVERFNQLQNLGRINQSGGSKEYEKILKDLGFEGEELKALMQDEKALRPLLQKLINEQIESQAALLRNTEEGNSVVKQISAAMRNVRSKYDEYAKAITQGVNNQISANSDIKNALARIQVGKLESNAEITEAFTGGSSTATRQAKTGAELAKIDSDFTANINEPITEATRTLFDILKSSVSTKVGKMATPGDNQTTALMNLDKLQASLPDLLESLNIENLQGILPSANEDFQGFDVKKIIDTLTPQVQGPDTKEGLDALEKQLNTANSILYEQRRIQQEQKVLLAQQKFTEIVKLFTAGIKESMGGFEGFLKGSFNEDSKALQDAASAIRIIGSNPQTRGGQIEVGRSLGIVTTELSKFSGLNIGEELAKFAPNVIAQIEGGQSKYIEDNLGNVFNSLAGLDEGIAQAFRTSLGKKFGLGDDASNKEIADATAKAQTSMQYELVPAISESIRKASIDQLKKDGGNQELIDLLNSPASAFLDPQSYTTLAIQESNGILRDILAAISEPVEGLNKPSATTPSSESGRGRAGGGGGGRPRQASDTGGAAGGFFPAFANSKESIIPNFKQQYEKEKRDQSKYGYSGGKPLLLSEENFNPLRDAIANPMQMALLGGMKSKSLGAAGGYFPNFAEPSPELLKRFLEVVDNPEELKKLLAPFEKDFQMLGRSGFSSSLEGLSERKNIGPYGGAAAKEFSKFSYQDLMDLGLFKETQFSNPAGKGGAIEIRNVHNYQEVIEEMTKKARALPKVAPPEPKISNTSPKLPKAAAKAVAPPIPKAAAKAVAPPIPKRAQKTASPAKTPSKSKTSKSSKTKNPKIPSSILKAAGKTPTGMIANLTKGATSVGKKLPYVGAVIGVGKAAYDYQQGMDPTEILVRAGLEAAGGAIGGLLGLVAGGGFASLVTGGLGIAAGNWIGSAIGDAIYAPKPDAMDPTANPSTRPPPGATLKAEKLEMSKSNVKKLDKPDEKPNKKQLDEMKQAMGPDLPSPDERKAIADKEIQAQLIRWQMGASAEFKNYDKDGVSTGIKSMYGQGGGQEVKGSNIDVTRQLAERTKAVKPSQRFYDKKINALRQQIQSEILPKSEFIGKQGDNMGAQTLINEAIAKGQTINAIDPKKPETGRKLSESNLQGLQRAITNKAGQVVGYSRRTVNPQTSFSGPGSYPRANKLIGGKGDSPATQINTKTGTGTTVPRAEAVTGGYREYSGPPGVYLDGKPYVPPYSEKSSIPNTSSSPGVYVDGKLWTPPEERNKILVGGEGDMPAEQVNLQTRESMQVPRAMPEFKMGGAATELGTQIPNPTADLGKLERTKDKEQKEAGVPRSQIYSLDLPELVTPDNPDGTGVFNKEDERTVEEARKAVERVYSFGKIRTPTNNAGGYFPNFAEPSSTSNNINVSVGVNITAGASASSIDKDALSAQIQTLLEVEVPKLNALKARVDRMGEVVTKVQEGNPGKYNLPPKQVPK